MSGGAGVGDPLERDPELVRYDVLNEYVSLESAKQDYGVIINPVSFQLDLNSTLKLRKELKEKNK